MNANNNSNKDVIIPNLEWDETEFMEMQPESFLTASINISINEEAMAKFGSELTTAEAIRLRPTHQIEGMADKLSQT